MRRLFYTLRSAVCRLFSWFIYLSSVLLRHITTCIKEKVSEITEIQGAGFVLESQLPLLIKKLLASWNPNLRYRVEQQPATRP